MSTKALVVILIGAGIIALLVGGYVGYTIKKDKPCPETSGIIYTKGDTVFVKADTVFNWYEKKPGIQVDSITYKQTFDSSFVSHRDTIGIKAEVEFNTFNKFFGLNMDIEHKDYEIFRTDTIRTFVTEYTEVEVIDPWLMTITVTSVILLILALIFGG